MKDILVFGAAGFIGAYLVDELVRLGHRVVASDISEAALTHYVALGIDFIPLDITEPADFDRLPTRRWDAVIHLAAMQPANFSAARHTPADYIAVNVLGTVNVLDFCRRSAAAKFIYACSHRNTSGLWERNVPIRETDGRAQEYHGEYAMFSISESAAQDCVEYYRANYGLRSMVFRLPPVYGYGPHLEIYKDGRPAKTGFQTFIDNAKACIPLEVWGDTSIGRDIIYVKDVVAAFGKAIDNDRAEGLYNISTGYALTLAEEVETIARVFWSGSTPPVIVRRPEIPHTMQAFVYDNSRAKRDLDWQPRYSFENLLHDYDQERSSSRFDYLLDKRSDMFARDQ